MSSVGGGWPPTGAEWQAIVDRHFAFLFDHGFRLFATGRDYGSSVSYATTDLAVQVTLSNEFRRVEVELARLLDGGMPGSTTRYTADHRVNGTLLDNIVEARRADLQEALPGQGDVGREQAEEQVAFWARTLREVAPDFLEGDESVFEDASRVITARFSGPPAGVALGPPEKTSTDDPDAVRDRVLRSLPPAGRFSWVEYNELVAATPPVTTDAQTRDVHLRYKFEPMRGSEFAHWWFCSMSLDRGGVTTSVDARRSRSEISASLADVVAHMLSVRELWPRCPVHPALHRLEATVIGGDAVWWCDRGDHQQPLGSLHHAPRS